MAMGFSRGSWGRVTLAIGVALAAGIVPLACGDGDSKPINTTGGGGPVGGGSKDGSTTSDGQVAADGQTTTDGTTTLPDGAPIDADGGGQDGNDVPDAPPKDAPFDGGGEGGGKITFDGGSAHIRLVHAAPDGASVDICIRKSGTTSWGSPVLGGGGLAFANAAAAGTYLDDYYDIATVLAPASDCTATTTIAVNVPLVDTVTIAYIETIVPPSNIGFEIAPIAEIGSPVSGQAAVRLHVTQGQSIDLYGIQGATTTLWFSGANPGRSTGFFGVAGGTYSIRANIATGAFQLLQVDNVTLANSDVVDLFLYSSFPGKTDTYNLLRCPITTGACLVN